MLGAVIAGGTVLILAGCVMITGPCTVANGQIVCDDGGKVMIMKPAHTIEVTGKAAEAIVEKIAADPNKADPRQLVPPRQRR
jgi:hypothetical protein